VCLQETHSIVENERKWRTEWKGEIYFSHGDSKSRGTAILFGSRFYPTVHSTYLDNNGRLVVLDLEVNGNRFTLACIYAPNIDDPTFFRHVITQIEATPNDNRIIGGDFNLVLNLDLDKKGGNRVTHSQSQLILQSYMEETELVDIFRKIHGNKKLYTWFRKKPNLIACRLDFFLVSCGMAHMVTQTGALAAYLSDHSRIFMKLKLSSDVRGPGFWKLNNTHLEDADYRDKIKKCIQDTLTINRDAPTLLLWETLKCAIRGESIKHGANKKRERNIRISDIENQIKILENKFWESQVDAEKQLIMTEISNLKEKLDRELTFITKGHVVRSRITDYELGEKCNNYFLNIEKRNYNRKHIKQLKRVEGTIENNPEAILEMQSNYYKCLYSKDKNAAKPEYIQSFVANYTHSLPCLSMDQSSILNEELTEDEIKEVLWNMKNNKTPGIDGLSAEFYKIFWPEIKGIFFETIKEIEKNKSLTITQCQGIISLLPKLNKDLLSLKNWRPLTLMNVDYKIITGCIAKRIKKVLGTLISHEQTGFVPGRYIGENIFKLSSIIEFCKLEHIDGMLVQIDFEKAFDTIDWQFIEYTLEKFKFPPFILSWIKIIYSGNNSSCVVNNGWKSDFFYILRGLKQGCPLSPILFILCGEILTNAIKNSRNIKGLNIEQFYCKILQFADDTCIVIKKDEDSLRHIFTILEDFKHASGLKINIDKTDILRLGPFAQTEERLCPQLKINWSNKNVKTLGVYVGNDTETIYELNFLPKIDKVRTIINIWNQRNLSIYGKSIIAKTFILSQFMYHISVLPVLRFDIGTVVNDILFKFLWNNKPDKIRRDVMCSDYSSGGIKYPNMTMYITASKIAWIKRILSDSNMLNIAKYFFPHLKDIKHVLLKCNLKKDDLRLYVKYTELSIIYEMFYCWCDVNYRKWHSGTLFTEEIVFFNSNVRINNKPVVNMNCIRHNVIRVKDFMIDCILFMTFDEFKHKYGPIINYLEFYGIVNCIKSSINNAHLASTVRSVSIPRIISPNIMFESNKPQKYVYLKLTNSNYTLLDNLSIKWSEMIPNIIVTPIMLYDLFRVIYKTTIDNRMRSFMWKYFHLRLYLNPELKRINIIDFDTCTFCHCNIETYQHLFFHCSHVHELWTEFNKYCSSRFNCVIDIGSVNCLSMRDMPIIIILIFFVTIHYIYKCRLLKQNVSVIKLYNEFHRIEYIEYNIAKSANKMHVHNRKWNIE